MSYGTTTSVFHLAMCHTVPRPVSFTWQCVIRYHDQKISMSSFKSCFWRKSQSFPKSLKKYTSSELGVELSAFVHLKDTGREIVATVYMVLRSKNYNNLVKTWRYSSLKEFEQTMLSISEISRLYRSIYTETAWYKCRRLASITFSRFVQIAIFVFWFSLKKRFQCLLQKLFLEKITELSQVTEKVYLVRTWSRTLSICASERHWSWYRMTLCQVKDTGRGTVWHFAMWNTLVVLSYGALSCCTGRGTIWRIVMFWQCVMRYQNQCLLPDNVSCGITTSVFQLAMCHVVPQPMYFTWQVLVPYDSFPGEIHWLWYRKTYC
jgi:hypothetical protein